MADGIKMPVAKAPAESEAEHVNLFLDGKGEGLDRISLNCKDQSCDQVDKVDEIPEEVVDAFHEALSLYFAWKTGLKAADLKVVIAAGTAAKLEEIAAAKEAVAEANP